MHVHIHTGRGEAKFWIEPEIDLAQNYGLSRKDLKTIRELIEDHADEIRAAWQEHFRN